MKGKCIKGKCDKDGKYILGYVLDKYCTSKNRTGTYDVYLCEAPDSHEISHIRCDTVVQVETSHHRIG